MKAGQKIFKNKCIPKEINNKLKNKPDSQVIMVLLYGYVVFAPWTKKSSIYFLNLDTELPILLKGKKKPTKIDLDLNTMDWSLKSIQAVNANDRVLLQLSQDSK